MKRTLETICMLSMLLACDKNKPVEEATAIDLKGTWQLISGTIIEKGDTSFTDYTLKHKMIKIINDTHFAFLNHDVDKGKNAEAMFSAGGGRYELKGDQYTEYLEYCNDRVWEGNTFQFTVKIRNDTLTQSGSEKIEDTKVNKMNIEKYVRIKK